MTDERRWRVRSQHKAEGKALTQDAEARCRSEIFHDSAQLWQVCGYIANAEAMASFIIITKY